MALPLTCDDRCCDISTQCHNPALLHWKPPFVTLDQGNQRRTNRMADDFKPSSDGESDRGSTTSRFPVREVTFEHSSQFVPLLQHLGCSLLVSTYAAGKVVSVGVLNGQLKLGFSNFQQAMGVAVGPRGVAVGGPNLVWLLQDAKSLAQQIDPAGSYDRGFLARESFVTGNIHVHELAWSQTGELWLVNTLFSCLCTLHEDYNFVPRWHPPFITSLAPQDRCHLNGLAMDQGRPKYVTALGVSDEPRGWRDSKANGGIVIDVESGRTVADGFCMPHSPRIHQGMLYLLDSGRGRLVKVNPNDGTAESVAEYPGYGRGLGLCGPIAFVGMSKARETSVFGGVPICQDRAAMKCGVVAVDLSSGRSLAYLEFKTGVEELFDVQVVAGTRNVVVCGPYPAHDQQTPVWVVPPPDVALAISDQSKIGTVSRRQTSNSSLNWGPVPGRTDPPFRS